jgi:hypothetical protein
MTFRKAYPLISAGAFPINRFTLFTWCLAPLIFVVNPLAGVGYCAISLWSRTSTRRGDTVTLAVLGACYLGLLNITKTPVSDMAVYMEWYAAAAELSFLDYLGLFSREYLFYSWTYLISYVSSGSEPFYIFCSTVVPYFFFLVSIARLGKHFALSPKAVALILLLFVFFGPLFSLSAHLMRQFFAATLVLTFYSTWIQSGRRPWSYLIAGTFMHYSAAFFFVPAFLKFSVNFSSAVKIIFVFLAVALTFAVARQFAGALSNFPIIGLIFVRIDDLVGADLGHLSLSAAAFNILVGALALALLKSRRVARSEGLFNLCTTVLMLVAGIFIANLFSETVEIGKRYFLYLYFLFAILVIVLVWLRREALWVVLGLSFITVLHFFISLVFGTWQYAAWPQMLVAPAWDLWSAR